MYTSFATAAARVLEGVGIAAPATLGVPVSGGMVPWISGGAAVLCMLVLTPLVIRGAQRWGWVAHPSDDRWHDRPVALMGGIALFASILVASFLFGGLEAFTWPVWVGVALTFCAGLADDLFDVRPEAKLIVQILATVLLLYAGYAFWRGGPFWLSVPLTFLWVIGITNAVNLIDGMDGLAGGISAIAAAVLAVVAWCIGHDAAAAVAAAVAGASAAFLVFNFKPARVFMGDCGSMVLGYLLAAVAMSVQGRGSPFAATLAPVVVLAVPIFDTTFVTVTRILSGTPVTQGGTDHTMHRLVLLGLSERRTVLTLYGVSLAFGVAALAVYWSTAQLFYALVLLAVVMSVVFGLYLASARTYGDAAPTLRLDPSPTASQRFGAVMQALMGGVQWKSIGGTVADLLLVAAAFIGAFHLRFEGNPPAAQQALMMGALPGIIGVKVGVFYVFGLYHGIWRHAGTPEIARLVGASVVASLLTGTGMALFYDVPVSTSVVVLDWMLTTAAIGGVRFAFRGLRQYFAAQRHVGRSVLIYGTGANAQLALRHFRQDVDRGRTPVGFVADDPARAGLRVQGLRVMGGLDDLPTLRDEHDVYDVIVPTEDVSRDRQRDIRRMCAEHGMSCHYFALRLQPAPLVELDAPAPSGDGASHRPSSGDGGPRTGETQSTPT